MPARVDPALLGDDEYFARNPGRQYRVRPTTDFARFIVIRRIGGTFLRVDLGDQVLEDLDLDSESVAERVWWENAYPESDARLRRAAIRRARRNGGAP